MKTFFSNKKIDYDGSQLRSGWVKEISDITGDAVAAFIGGCDVKNEFMVDMEDLDAGESIYSEEMLHFIAEHEGASLAEITLRQRLMICCIKEALEKFAPSLKLKRDGDDIFEGKCKMTISIATTSPVSGLIHTGINISSKNTPVLTKGLKDISVDPTLFGKEVLKKYKEETDSVAHCFTKVKKVS